MAVAWPFVGRAHELARAQSLLDADTGLLILGESGVGKSALARTLAGHLRAAGASVSQIVGHAVSTGVPFAAFAGVTADVPAAAPGQPQLTPAAVAARVVRDLPNRTVLVVDDAHLLDERSAQVVLQLVADGAVRVVATGQPRSAPTAIERLWRDGWCERIELVGLAEDEVVAVLEQVLEGPIDLEAARTFHRRSQGNPLLLRELVRSAVDARTLVRRSVAWVLAGNPPLSSGIRDLVSDRLAGLSGVEQTALELVAAGEPLPAELAVALLGETTLDALDAHRLIAQAEGLDGVRVRTAHPLYGEVLRADIPALRLRRLRLELAAGLEDAARPTAYDLVRAAVWRLDSGQPGDPAVLLAAARAARRFSLSIAERLARHVHDTSGSLPAAVLLAEILTHSGRVDEASALTATLPPESLGPAEREAIVYCAAVGQGFLSGDAGGGADLVAGVAAGDPAAANQLRALYASLLAFDARLQDALDAGTEIADDALADPTARTFAAIGTVGARYWLGQSRRAVAEADQLAPVATLVRESVPYGAASLRLLAICALLDAGDINGAEARAVQMRHAAAEDADPFAGPRAEYCIGKVALLRGKVGTARRQFERCLATVSPFDQFIVRHLASMLGISCALGGDGAAAAEALALGADAPRAKTYEPEWQLAEAALLASRLQLEEAADRAAWAAGIAADRSQWNIAVAAFHDAARYGGARLVVAPLRSAVAKVDGTLAWCYLDHAVALLTRDGTALDEVTRRFETHGALLLAAEAAGAAALAHAADGDIRPARASGIRSSRLRSLCEGAASPWLTGAPVGIDLTVRERQVAALAASGHSDANIAARLNISKRTAQTHLAHIYAKLGVTGRADLAERLSGR